jgi:hypothetical protein
MEETSLLSTLTLPELADLVRRNFSINKALVQPAAEQLFIKDPIGSGKGNTKRYHEYDVQTFARRKRQGEASKQASVGLGYYVTLEKKRIAMEVAFTQEMIDENQYPEVGTAMRSLSQFCPQRTELDLTHILTFSNATSYTDMDGDTVTTSVGDSLSLVYTLHTLKFSSATYSNRVSGDPIFSGGGLTAAENLMTTNILSNFGEKRRMSFNKIVTSDDPETVKAVKQVMQSTADVDGAHAGVMNVNKNAYTHVVLPYLATDANGNYNSSKARWWFLIAATGGTDGWQAYYATFEAEHLKTANGSNEDFSRDIYKEGVRKGYGVRAVTGRGVIGSLAQ